MILSEGGTGVPSAFKILEIRSALGTACSTSSTYHLCFYGGLIP
jgi:hypothetical protein